MESRLRGEFARIAASSDPAAVKVRRCLKLRRSILKRIEALREIAYASLERGEIARGRQFLDLVDHLQRMLDRIRGAAVKWLRGGESVGFNYLQQGVESWRPMANRVWRPSDLSGGNL